MNRKVYLTAFLEYALSSASVLASTKRRRRLGSPRGFTLSVWTLSVFVKNLKEGYKPFRRSSSVSVALIHCINKRRADFMCFLLQCRKCKVIRVPSRWSTVGMTGSK